MFMGRAVERRFFDADFGRPQSPMREEEMGLRAPTLDLMVSRGVLEAPPCSPQFLSCFRHQGRSSVEVLIPQYVVQSFDCVMRLREKRPPR
jgi:hypothetical protein